MALQSWDLEVIRAVDGRICWSILILFIYFYFINSANGLKLRSSQMKIVEQTKKVQTQYIESNHPLLPLA